MKYRNISVLLIVLLLVTILAACTQEAAPEASEAAETAADQPEEARVAVDEVAALVVECVLIGVGQHQREVRAATRHQERVSVRVQLRAAHVEPDDGL